MVRRTAALVFGVATILTGAVTHPADSAPAYASPESAISNPVGALSALSALGPDDVWAAGYGVTPKGESVAAVLHWEGAHWTSVPTPHPGLASHLDGIAMVDATHGWAVGTYHPYHVRHVRPLLLEWDGTAWTIAQFPTPGSHSNELTDVTAVDSSHAWAVGMYVDRHGYYKPYTLRWDGTAWTLTHLHDWGAEAVSAAASDDVWAVGAGRVYHYDGRHWRHTDTFAYVGAIDARTPQDVWSVGWLGSNFMIMHWDGTSWTHVESHPGGGTRPEFDDVSADADDDAWAVGSKFYKHGPGYIPAAHHWDGTEWRAATLPAEPDNTWLAGVVSVTPDDVWAVGAADSHQLMMHWDGSAWSNVDVTG